MLDVEEGLFYVEIIEIAGKEVDCLMTRGQIVRRVMFDVVSGHIWDEEFFESEA